MNESKSTLDKLQDALSQALDAYQDNKAAGSPAESLAYDAGRIAGLRLALELLEGDL